MDTITVRPGDELAGGKTLVRRVKEEYRKKTSLQEFLESINTRLPEINMVEIMKNLPKFVDTLEPLERNTFLHYYIKGESIWEIAWMEFPEQYTKNDNRKYCQVISYTIKDVNKKFISWVKSL